MEPHRHPRRRNPGTFILAAAVILLAPIDLLGIAGPKAAAAQESPPAQSSPLAADLEEEVEVRILQLEVTAWPKSGLPNACQELEKEDFQVLISGQPREVLAADRLGAYGEPVVDNLDSVTTGVSPALETDPGSGFPMQYVVVFDTLHIDMWKRECGRTLPLAFSWVREMLEDRFQPGDRVMLATLSKLPQFYTPWLDNRQDALQALDQMEVGPGIIQRHSDHTHDFDWLAGWKLLLESLGNVPGRKQVIYLGDDWRAEWSPGLMVSLPAVGARAQKNHVLIDSVDTMASCRIQPRLALLGLSTPQIIAILAEQSGGHLFAGGQTVSSAVDTLRQMQSCRFLLSVGALSRDRRKNGLRMRAVLRRRDFRLAAPARVEDPRRGATEEEKLQALFLLPHLEQGLFTRADLWPVRPTGEKNRWNALFLAHIQKTDTAKWPLDIEEIIVDAVAYQRRKVFGEYQWVLRDERLAAFRDAAGGRSFTFPVTVPAGEISVAVTAKAIGATIGATTRTSHVLPEPPSEGEAHPWFLTDRVIRIGRRLSLAPSTKSSFLTSQPPMILGFGCPPKSGDRSPGHGKLVSQGGESERQIGIRWFDLGDDPPADPAACQWLIGEIEPPLAPGLWDFHAPSFGGESLEKPALTFRMRTPDDAGSSSQDALQR